MSKIRIGHIVETSKAGERVVQVIDKATGKPFVDVDAIAAEASEKPAVKKVPKN